MELVEDDPSMLKDIRKWDDALRVYRQLKSAPKAGEFREVKVIVLWGDTGTGKSRMANDAGAYSLASYKPEWWDGYRGHKAIHLEDFKGGLPYVRFLRILDGYKIQLPVKGGFEWAEYTPGS